MIQNFHEFPGKFMIEIGEFPRSSLILSHGKEVPSQRKKMTGGETRCRTTWGNDIPRRAPGVLGSKSNCIRSLF